MSITKRLRNIKVLVLSFVALACFGMVSEAAQIETEPKKKDNLVQLSLNASTGMLTEYQPPEENAEDSEKEIVVSQRQEQAAPKKKIDPVEYENKVKFELNEWTLGLAAGKPSGATVQMASELSSVLDDGNNLHIIPMLTRGPTSNIHALLYLKGVDLAIVNADSLDFYRNQNTIANFSSRIHYITQLYLSEMHILVRPGINTLEDLQGKVVNFDSEGTASAFTGPMVFERLGVKIKASNTANNIAMQKIRDSEEISAIVFVTGKPIDPLRYTKWPEGFKLLPLKYNAKLTDYYLPTTISASEYPGLITEGQSISTIAVPTLLAVYNWKTTSKRYLKVERFIQYMLKRWKTLQEPPFHEKWRTINLNASIPGWTRFPAMQEQLDLMARLNRDSAIKKVSSQNHENDQKLKQAFDRFLRNYARANGLSTFTQEQRDKLFQQFHKFWKETGR